MVHANHLLRERVIGSVVFGRKPDYEPGEDPIVRLRAADLRRRLAQYYQSFVQPDAEPDIVIEVLPGSYRATFRSKDGRQGFQEADIADNDQLDSHPDDTAAPTFAPSETSRTLDLPTSFVSDEGPFTGVGDTRLPFLWFRSLRPWRFRIGILAVVALLLLCTGWQMRLQRPFDQFWAPWMTGSKPVIISIGSNAVYNLSESYLEPYAQAHSLTSQGTEFYVPLAPNEIIYGRDLVPAHQSFVALGDVAAVSTLVGSLVMRHQQYQERFPNDISFAELRNNASILIGGFNNPMTLELTRGLPFVFHTHHSIEDTTTGRIWELQAPWDAHDTEDYAIVTRLAVRRGDAPVLSVAGIGSYGTVAAANFVCSPGALAELGSKLPRGWSHRNLQVLLHVKVIDFKAVAVEEISQHLW